ncbi:MAG: patatin family protein [Erysipelotrichaceae bacterium]|nr:patatin family protein [Erysipelotrichaceae bacterium]
MSKIRTSLVLEGGGMRGAYTAGALSWLIDNGVEFDRSYGISTGAVYLCNFLMKAKDKLFDFSVNGIVDKRILWWRAFLRCGKIVDYDYLFDQILTVEKKFDISPLKKCKREGFIGIYDLSIGKTEYHSTKEIDMKELQASTALPILGKSVKYNGKELMDGGITDMIPVTKAVEDGCNRHLIITTKPGNYVRKPAKKVIVELMRLTYPQCANISKDYEIRHLNYQKQIDLIKDLEEKKEAVYVYPSRSSKVTRLGGTSEELTELYNLGYSDMEENRERIFELLGINA